jgi:hypothetical protein
MARIMSGQPKPPCSRGAIRAAMIRHGIVSPGRSSRSAAIPAIGADVDTGELIAAAATG